MTSLLTRDGKQVSRSMRHLVEDEEMFEDLLKPIVAGARARGIADAFEMMGVAAILLDGVGTVLHVGAPARGLLEGRLRLANGRLVAADAEIDAALRHLIAEAAGSAPFDPHGQSLVVPGEGKTPLSIEAFRLPETDEGAVQRLRAILVVAEIRH